MAGEFIEGRRLKSLQIEAGNTTKESEDKVHYDRRDIQYIKRSR